MCGFLKIGHQEVIALLVGNCGINSPLASALKAVGDVMVSDYHGNQQHDSLWFRAIYLKIAVTRTQAMEVLMETLPMLRSLSGRDDISWGAEMHSSNRPPRKDDLAIKQQQQVFIPGPVGPLDCSLFERHSVESVPAMAESNVSFEFMDALKEVAAK